LDADELRRAGLGFPASTFESMATGGLRQMAGEWGGTRGQAQYCSLNASGFGSIRSAFTRV
jgi:hypothetical protein